MDPDPPQTTTTVFLLSPMPNATSPSDDGQHRNESERMVHEGISGHIEASLVWFTVGFLYILMALRRYYCWRSMGKQFVSSVEFPCDFLSGPLNNLAAIGAFKFVGACVYLGIEAVASSMREPGCIVTPVWQHETMATIFLISGLTDVVVSSKRIRRRLMLPDGTDYVVFAITFAIQTQQFVFHLEGRTPLSTRLHGIQGALAAACFLSLMLEARYRFYVMMPVVRGYCIMTQGTWMMNLMFILYHPGYKHSTWNESSHESVNLASLMFTYHLIINMALVMSLNLFFVWLYSSPKYFILPRDEFCDKESQTQSLLMKEMESTNDSSCCIKQHYNYCDGPLDDLCRDGGDDNNIDTTDQARLVKRNID